MMRRLLVSSLVLAATACASVKADEPDASGGDDGPDGAVASPDAMVAATCAMLNCDDGDACTTDSCVEGPPATCMRVPVVVPGSPRSFAYTGTLQTFAVPACVTSITIEASGAQGGNRNGGAVGGLGARMRGTFAVVPGVGLSVLVGQQGGPGTYVAGGGGGTFVWETVGMTPMIVAGGGGGGAGTNLTLGAGRAGVATVNGTPGNGATTGAGVNGQGGTTPTALNWAAGGAGWASAGAPGGGGQVAQFSCAVSGGGQRALAGGQGGAGGGDAPGVDQGNGGYGGGGGSQGRCGTVGGGGGGGYSGGGGGTEQTANNFGGGGGGGSFNAGTSPVNQDGINAGNGSVVISW
jgi:hypothetical protein